MLFPILVSWSAATLGLWLASKTLRGVRLGSFTDALWAGALLGVLQWALGKALFIALGIGTLGLGFLLSFLTHWVVAALIVMLTSKVSSRMSVDGFFTALVTAFIVSVMGTVVRWLA
jgi:uncharacterized membrane protein YvlD (DUF360 family)